MANIKGWVLSSLPEGAATRLRAWRTRRNVLNASWSADPDLPVLKLFVKPGSVAIDIGANVGLFSRFLAELVGEEGKVISVEPVHTTYSILRGTMSGFPQVDVRNIAISDRVGSTEMAIPRYKAGYENFYRARLIQYTSSMEGAETFRRVQVETTTADSLHDDVSQISFVKVDVEGHEPAVLRGAARILAARRAAWLVEAPGDPTDLATSTGKVFETFANHRYRASYWNGSELVPADLRERHLNYLFEPG